MNCQPWHICHILKNFLLLNAALTFLFSRKKKVTHAQKALKWKFSLSLWLAARHFVALTPLLLVDSLPGTVSLNTDVAELPYAHCVKITMSNSECVSQIYRENIFLRAAGCVLPVNMQVTRLAAERSRTVSDPQNVIRSVWLWSVVVWC